MRKSASSARVAETGGLKHCLNYLLPNPFTQVLVPAIPKSESKSNRGLAHPILRYFILGWEDRLKLPPLVLPTVDAAGNLQVLKVIVYIFSTDTLFPASRPT
jgi:hypothetical protein